MSQKFVFEKMHGIGNDFVLIDRRKQSLDLSTEFIKHIANRNTGIGFDQLLVLDYSNDVSCDANYRFFNPDGSEAEQCGNGQRCITLYLHHISPNKFIFTVSGLAGLIDSEYLDVDLVKVNMGQVKQIQAININNTDCLKVDFGNPHLVKQTKNLAKCDFEAENNKYTPMFKQGINFELLEVINKKTIKLRVFERGTGETLACGSGACAAVFAMQYSQNMDDSVKVIMPGGELLVQFNQDNKNIYLTGAAKHVFSGEMQI